VTAFGRRSIAWPAAVIGIGSLAALRLQHLFDPAAVLLLGGMALVLITVGRRRFFAPSDGLVQTAGWLAFALLALLSVALDPQFGKYVLATGWLGHALWDLWHWRANKGVSRSFAEWCGVFDLLGAVAILSFPLS
jgi:hypothetical protein